ncbi:hypothetical protein L596_007738 [Steinernema carpocapsae]|uniref:Vacuolar protein sorting-associated protein 72 homolog n=1 Tax=Steinernema carpocapsae TaxID=34508 RepID=A0A4U5PB98_STECR|nr:hypothetical protein L596_007738 [Steinernema carpocapsae]
MVNNRGTVEAMDLKKRESGDEEMKSEDEEESEDEFEGEAAPPPELMCTNRSKRATAGNKMAQLMKEAIEEQEKDDFYKTTYNGLFLEDDQMEDQEFTEPVESDGDEVDSDFDRSENEDEEENGEEVEDERKTRKRGAYEDSRNKSKKWMMARMGGGASVPANTVSEKLQQFLMKEAAKTEEENLQSLKKYEQFELEKKKKREKAQTKHRVKPPFVKLTSSEKSTLLTVPEIRSFESLKVAVKSMCAVTGHPAKYFDPITKLPYATPEAFKIIRKSYFDYLKTIQGNSKVDEYLSKFETM